MMRTYLLTFFCLVMVHFASAQMKPIVVVELFTSEGCSSCPPADKLLSKIVSQSHEEVEVLGLSFHVSYWDYIGWKDPYASQGFVSRQRTYARKFYNSSTYTPQMVVNGKHEFVGSNQSEWRDVFDKERKKTFLSTLEISSVSIQNNQLSVTVSSPKIEKSLLNVAIVEKGLSQNVTRGENRGKVLLHSNVVRAYASRPFDGKSNQFQLEIPQGLNLSNASLILYTQQQDTWHVNAAKAMKMDQIE